MIPGIEEPTMTTGAARDLSDDTVEIELTGEQGLALSRAAEASGARAPHDESGAVMPVSEYKNSPSERTARIDFAANVTFAAVVLILAVVFLWPAPARHPPAPAVVSIAPLAAVTPPAPVVPQGAPVRIANAFDGTEVFEFPHGTTDSDARKAVAELLLSRARDRRAEAGVLRRAASLQVNRGAALEQPELVTRLLVRAKEPLNGTN